MKRIVYAMILIILIGLSGAASPIPLNKQMDIDLGTSLTNKIADHSGQENTVVIKGNAFQPSTFEVTAGTIVTWNNQDVVAHTVSSDMQDLFNSGPLAPGKKYTYTFSRPGSYRYHCSIHPGMQGLIVVVGTDSKNESGAASWREKSLSLSSEVGPNKEQSISNQESSESKSLNSESNKVIEKSNSQSEVLEFSEYYHSTSEVPMDRITAPTRLDITGEEPSMLYFGTIQKGVPYTEYQKYTLTAGMNSLWIQGATSWTEYAMVPLGSMLNFVAMSNHAGNGYLYEIDPDGALDKQNNYFYPYNQMEFYADKVGQHQLFYNIAGQPSNVIVIDVVPYQPPVQPINNYAAITISSSWLRGFDVSVDGIYKATEGGTGPAGSVTINVPGDQYHSIAIDGDGFTFSDYKYFQAGFAYSLNIDV